MNTVSDTATMLLICVLLSLLLINNPCPKREYKNEEHGT